MQKGRLQHPLPPGSNVIKQCLVISADLDIIASLLDVIQTVAYFSQQCCKVGLPRLYINRYF